MTEGKRFDVVLLLEVDGSVIEKASDASTLNFTTVSSARIQDRNFSLRTRPPYISMTRTSPSNLFTVYMLEVPISFRPSLVYQT